MALLMPFSTSRPLSSTKLETFQVSPDTPAARIFCASSASQIRELPTDKHQKLSRLFRQEKIQENMSKSSMIDHPEKTDLRISYQGVSGAYSEAAAKLACLECIPVSCRSIVDAIETVENGQVDCAIVPVESTMDGNKVRNYDILLKSSLHVTQEINLFVHYCLLAIPGVKKRELKRVISHPLALAHCSQGLARLGLTALQEAVDDTAGEVELLLSQQLLDTAAIASPRAADLYSLQILAQGLQDESWNVTRFLILSKRPHKSNKRRNLKTSMVIGHQGGLQPLLQVLSVFSSRNINLTKLEIKNATVYPLGIFDLHEGSTKEFQHLFYVDFEGSIEYPKVKDAVVEISKISKFIRILGCYPADSKIYDLQ